jgi:uncharacterized protein YjiS (DUF1127 family)
MRNQNDNDIGATSFPAAWKTADKLSAREQAHYLRQVEMAKFIRQAARMLIKSVVGWNKRMTLSRELNAKPDYLLKDMGLSRWEIPAVVSGELGRKTPALSPVTPSSSPAFTGNGDGGDNGNDRNETPPLAA